MTAQELQGKLREFKEYSRMIEELEDLKDSVADIIKAYMTETGESKLITGESKLITGEYKVSYTDQKRETLNKKRLEQDLGDLSEYTKTTQYKALRVS
ncbi:MAG: hypothetical protein FWG64_01430 [Firmicutes bacterium]|nr:hypothetical protein [Bacillota bacterium]